MRFLGIFLTVAAAALAPLASAASGQAWVLNDCETDYYLWSVDSSVSAVQTVPAQEAYKAPIHDEPAGVSLKVAGNPNGLYDGSPVTTFSYTVSGSQIYYNLADNDGDLFAGKKLVVHPSDQGCPSIIVQNGTIPEGENLTQSCTTGTDLVFILCSP